MQRVPNLAPEKTFEPMEQTIGQDTPRVMKSTGPAKDALEPTVIQVVDRPVDGEKLAMLKFMEDPITIFVHESTNPSDETIFDVCNGGKREIFRRGETKTVARKFVDILATRKITTYAQQRVQNSQGIWEDKQIPRSTLRYPFSVQHDPHPRGADWLNTMLRQG